MRFLGHLNYHRNNPSFLIIFQNSNGITIFQRAEYQDQLARKRQQEEAALKQKLQDESLRRQEESVQKQEAIRKGMTCDEMKIIYLY